MSRSNAAAINRRVNVPTANQPGNTLKPTNTTTNAQINNTSQPSGFTLPQVISVIDNRLITLEKFMRETTQNQLSNIISNNETNQNNVQYNIQEKQNFNTIESVSISDFNLIVNEFNNRFELFAHEISEMKDIVLKLQTYTMDVNKTLLEERIHVFSDLNNDNNLVNTNNDDSNKNIEIQNVSDN